MTEPINNPGVPPIQPSPVPGRDKPGVGSGEEAGQRPFSLPPGPSEKNAPSGTPETDKPSPMEVARDMDQSNKQQLTPEQLQNQLGKIQDQLSQAKNSLNDPNVTKKFTNDHYNALSKLVDKMTPDMRTIANTTNSQFPPIQKKPGGDVLQYVSQWIDGSQGTLSSALDYLGKDQKPDPTSFLKLQFAVQRASQRGELFASIIGSSVSGIKTIMSTQLG